MPINATLRKLVPTPLQPLARSTHHALGQATSGLRLMPSFLVVGGQRCGTTSIFKALSEHPEVVRPPVEKGIDYFTLHYFRSMAWYQSHFALTAVARARSRTRRAPVAFEACTYYMFHPFALERVATDMPDVKLVAVLRDPVERAFSAYKHELARGYETEPDFTRALELEDSRLDGEVERMQNDLHFESHAHRHQAYRRRGQYAEQLERAFALFPKEQIHVLESESFFATPQAEYDRLTDFLGLSRFSPDRFDQHNARPGPPMPAAARSLLEEHYQLHERRLADLLGHEPAWTQSEHSS